ncbi:hypothetical protein DFH06DRAFT_705722 [Mycena polygramma]|nr:hypothetical protein DFH06DRAFT_705722 [Mycena polygramma]
MPFSLAPALAAFVVITIDPVATLQALDDPVATEASLKMVPQKYVGYVSKAVNTFDWKAPYHTYAIQLTSPMVPAACESEGISADMCIPLSPAEPHPHGRAPLRLRGALPWSGCQQPSFMRSVVHVPVRVDDDSAAVFLEPADAFRHRRIVAEEDARRRALLRDLESSGCATGAVLPGARGYVEFSDLDEYTGDFTCPIPIDLMDCDSDSDNCEERYYADAVEASRPPDTMVVVHVSYDLAQLDELPDPLQFFEEKRLLERLEAESRARKAGTLKIATDSSSKVSTKSSHIEPPAADELALIAYPDSRWSLWEYHKLLELFTTIRIPVSLIREVATKTRRLAVSLGRMREDGLNWVQGWTGLF